MTEQIEYKIIPMSVAFGIVYYISENGIINLFDHCYSYEDAEEEIERRKHDGRRT